MDQSPTKLQTGVTPQVMDQLRAGAEKELGIVLTPQLPRQLILPAADRDQLFAELEERGVSVVEIKRGKADLGFLARSVRFDDDISQLPSCSTPSAVETLAGQRFVFHCCNALALNLRYGVSLRTPKNMIHEDTSSNAFFMGKTLHEDNGSPLTIYGEQSIIPILTATGITITDRMRELDSQQVLLAIDLRGYGELTNRLSKDFIAMRYNWCLEAVCPPPKEHMHILGRVEVSGLPPRDAFRDDE
jgi:hypothetical protein